MGKTRFTAQLSRAIGGGEHGLEAPAYTTDTPGLVVHKQMTDYAPGHQLANTWTVTHAASGLSINVGDGFPARQQAIAAANAIAHLADWALPEDQMRTVITHALVHQIGEIFGAIRNGEKLSE